MKGTLTDATCADAPSAAGSAPRRRRCRWPRGLVLLFGGWLVFLLLVRLAWGWEAQRRLDRALAASRAAGTLLEWDELANVPPLANEDNAAWWVERAARVPQVARASQAGFDGFEIAARLDDGYGLLESEAAWMVDTRPALLALRAARGCTQSQARVTLARPFLAAIPPLFSESRACARTLGATLAACAHEDDWARYVEFARDGVALERALDDRRLALLGRLVGAAVRAISVSDLSERAATMDIDSPRSVSSGCPATRSQIHTLIAELLDERAVESAWFEAIRAEAAEARESLTSPRIWTTLMGGSPTSPMWAAIDWLGQPLFLLEGVRARQTHDVLCVERGRGRFASVPAAAPTPRTTSLPGQLASAAFYFLTGTPGRCWEIESRGRADRRMAACALALRLYEIDNDRLPEKLDELVPDYLPTVPRDPFDPNDGPIRYKPDPERPSVYSLGGNMVDNGGDWTNDEGRRWPDPHDLVRFYRNSPIARESRYSSLSPYAPATQPVFAAPALPEASLTPVEARRQLLEAGPDDRQAKDTGRDERE